MPLAILAAALVTAQAPSAADYFPLVAGARRTYEEQSLQPAVTTDVVSAPVEVGGEMATPVQTFQNGRLVSSLIYRVKEGAVDIVATNKDTPLPMPLPILRVPTGSEKKATWTFYGPGSAEKMAEPVTMKGESQFKGEREFRGRRVPVLEVRTVATMGGGRAKEESEQIALYGKGIGLIEMKSTTKIGKRKVTALLKLTEFETPKEGD